MQIENTIREYVGNKVADFMFEQTGINVGDRERVGSLALGALTAGLAMAPGRSLLGRLFLLGTAGSFLYRGATGVCPVYSNLGINRADDGDRHIRVGGRGNRGQLRANSNSARQSA